MEKVLGMVGFPRVVGLLEKNNQLCVVHAKDCQQLFSLGLNDGYCLCVCCACSFTCLPVRPPFRQWFDPFPVCTAEQWSPAGSTCSAGAAGQWRLWRRLWDGHLQVVRLCDGVCQTLERLPSSQPWYRVRIDLVAEHQTRLGAQSCCGSLPGEGTGMWQWLNVWRSVVNF